MKEFLVQPLRDALQSLGTAAEIQFEKPADEKFGDLSTNVAMQLARDLKKNPRQIAADIVSKLVLDKSVVEKVGVAGAGFINFYFAKGASLVAAKEILLKGATYGEGTVGAGQRAIVEYVSANPTGPLTVGRGRGAVLGDTIANLLAAQGYAVTREYYFNNAGRQMRILADSVRMRYLELCGDEVSYPEDYYQGDYIKDIARNIFETQGASLRYSQELTLFKETAEAEIFESIKQTLARLGIAHDAFFNENTLYEIGESGTSRLDDVISRLREKGYIEEREGAVWFKTSLLGKKKVEDKIEIGVDTVLVKSTGEPSYRLPDIAYHINKFARDFDLMVNVFGADHIDEYPDVLRALKVLGYDETKVKVAINQFVTTTVNGEVVKMSTRKGNADTLDALIDDVGADATRFFFIMRNKETHLNFDLELAKKQTPDNPVFYLQYAHARISGILRLAVSEKNFVASANEYELLTSLTVKEEIDLAKILLEFPAAIERAALTLEPNRLITYLNGVAEVFHKFYHECRIIGEPDAVMKPRLYLILAARQVFQNGFKILGISAPEKM
ncbi:MAG: arginine--tRNA ligase [Rhizobacter sp.]|nr:arginine--tRNA ligase [Chlorobiales bacterium]